MGHRPAEDDAKGGHAEAHEEEHERGEPEGAGDVVDGVGAEVVGEEAPHQDPSGQEAGDPDRGLERHPHQVRSWKILVELLQIHPGVQQ